MAGAPASLRVLTLNVHKGITAVRRKWVLEGLRDAVRSTRADVLCLQEVVGEDLRGNLGLAHHTFLAHEVWPDMAYGGNARTARGEHGNAILSRFPIATQANHDVSCGGGEPRGVLSCTLDVPGWPKLGVTCVHMGLREAQRQQQAKWLCGLMQQIKGPLVVAGDFNDWKQTLANGPMAQCGLRSAFSALGQPPPRTFPSIWPVLKLDHVYVRGLAVESAMVLAQRPWPWLSDHLPLCVEVKP